MEKFRRAWDKLNSCPIDIRSLSRARNGKKCECTCIECKKPLIAYQGFIRAWHFRHRSKTECKGGPITALHWMAQFLLKGHHTIKTITGKVEFFNGEMEYNIPGSLFKADVAGDKTDGSKFLVEIFVSHKLEEDGKKVKHISDKKIHSIEIDLSKTDHQISNEDLLEILLNDISKQRIIYEPDLVGIKVDPQQKNIETNDLLEEVDQPINDKNQKGSNFVTDLLIIGASFFVFKWLSKKLSSGNSYVNSYVKKNNPRNLKRKRRNRR